MNEIFILDSSILIDNLRTRRHSAHIASYVGLMRVSSVVLAELWRGAVSGYDRDFIEDFAKSRPVFTPSEKIWIDSGQILGEMHREKGFEPRKLRDLHFDVLIALTARAHGAKLITSNRSDFELIREYREFKLEVW